MEESSDPSFWQEVIRNAFLEPVVIALLFVLFVYWIYKSIVNYRENGISRGTYFNIIILIFLLVIPISFILLTEAIALKASQFPSTSYMTVGVFRWGTLFGVLCPLATIMTYKYSKFKSGLTMFWHLFTLLIGWLRGEWLGIIFVSFPILAIFYFLLFHHAQIVFPASNPESKEEKNNKFRAMFWYIWGAQYPFWVAESSATRSVAKRVDGNYFKDFGHPGIVWMYSHQVVGQSVGVEFNNADGPGITFVEQYERPIAIVDLRTQLRPTLFDAITKDGIQIKAVVFVSFKIDQDDWSEWDKETRHRIWRVAPILQDGLKPDENIGSSYPYSAARIHAVLSTSSISSPTDDEATPNIYWDEIVVQRVVKEARLVLSERTFDELWVPKKDSRGASALDEIAGDIKDRSIPYLREIGVQLFASRVVNFVFEEDSPLRKQLITTWISSWEQRINSIKLDGKTVAERLRSQARTSAKATFLASVAESLARARNVNGDLPKQVVALNFIATLKGLLQTTNGEDMEQQSAKLEAWKLFMRNNRGDES